MPKVYEVSIISSESKVTVVERLQDALKMIDQIDTLHQPWDVADEKLHQVQGLVQEALDALD